MKKFPLWEGEIPYYDESVKGCIPSLSYYPVKTEGDGKSEKNGCLIICPGGSYVMKAPHEGISAAEYFSDRGFTCFLLDYRVYPYDCRAICADVNRAVKWVRYHAKEFNIAPDKIALMGFSAGGHLAAMGATCYDLGRDDGDEIDRTSSRPDAAIPCYPVISMWGDCAHDHSRYVLIGRAPDEIYPDLVEKYSPDLAADGNTPPMFIWHTAEDNCVDVENSVSMATALSKHKVPFELHVFDKGPHSIGVDDSFPGAGQWVELSINWLKKLGF